jgi:hypothetical protein
MVQPQRLDKDLRQGQPVQSSLLLQQPVNPKNLRSSHNIASIILMTKHIPYPIQNPQKHYT